MGFWSPRKGGGRAHLDEVDFDKGRYEQGPRRPADVAGDEDQPREQERAVLSRRADEVPQVLGRDGQPQQREQQRARDEQAGQGPRRRRERHGRRQEGRHPSLVVVRGRAASEASRLVQQTRVLDRRQFGISVSLLARLYLSSRGLGTRRVESRLHPSDTSPIPSSFLQGAPHNFGHGRRDFVLLCTLLPAPARQLSRKCSESAWPPTHSDERSPSLLQNKLSSESLRSEFTLSAHERFRCIFTRDPQL